MGQETLFTSVVCVMELRYGTRRRPRGGKLWERIAGQVLPSFKILPLDIEELLKAAEILASLDARGEPIAIEDVLIGATALQHRLALVTRNVRHLARIEGLDVVSWW